MDYTEKSKLRKEVVKPSLRKTWPLLIIGLALFIAGPYHATELYGWPAPGDDEGWALVVANGIPVFGIVALGPWVFFNFVFVEVAIYLKTRRR